MTYTQREEGIIIADSFVQLNYKQKKLFLASVNTQNPERQKYTDALIKMTGEGVYNKLTGDFFDKSYRKKILGDLDKRGVVCITIKSNDYPHALKHTPVPPLVLYTRGNLSLLNDKLFAVVGSRKITTAAKELCRRVTEDLTGQFTIVTGVADGGDSAAISAALPSGKIICVLPCGHDGKSSANTTLLKKVEKSGLTVSEYPPTVSAQRFTFLVRNRIIAGLTSGVLVVAAAERSGALNTSSYAADYGRDVFAFPYFAGIASGSGCNRLIKNGAYLCESANDVFEVYGMSTAETAVEELDDEQKKIVNLLREEGELHTERIAAALGKKPFEVMAICSALEIKGIVIKTAGNKYAVI